MRRVGFTVGMVLGFAATLGVVSSGLVGCERPAVQHVELEPGTFIAVVTLADRIEELGLTSARLFWDGEDEPVILEYTSADDGERYRVEYTIVDQELQPHGG